jgi:hypothetical protein
MEAINEKNLPHPTPYLHNILTPQLAEQELSRILAISMTSYFHVIDKCCCGDSFFFFFSTYKCPIGLAGYTTQ